VLKRVFERHIMQKTAVKFYSIHHKKLMYGLRLGIYAWSLRLKYMFELS